MEKKKAFRAIFLFIIALAVVYFVLYGILYKVGLVLGF